MVSTNASSELCPSDTNTSSSLFQPLTLEGLDCPVLSDSDVNLIESVSYW